MSRFAAQIRNIRANENFAFQWGVTHRSGAKHPDGITLSIQSLAVQE
jgi:hypothetical protein